MNCTADEVIEILGLQPLPGEGGYYHETFRDERMTDGKRSVSTAIYFLLKRNERSNWHRLDATEICHWHAGAPLQLDIADGKTVKSLRLGPDLKAGERPQAIIPVRAWQRAESLGDWTLVGCTVAPAFEFSGFELAPQNWEPDVKVA